MCPDGSAAQAYTRAYWRALRRRWEDAVSVVALDSLSNPDELRRIAAELGWPPERAERAVEMLGGADRLDGSLSTRLFTDFFHRVQAVGAELDLSCARVPLVGTLPSGRINALAIQVPVTAEYVLAFDSGLWTFADALAECVASAFAADGADTVSTLPHPAESEANRAALAMAARVVARYLFTGNPFFPDYPLPSRATHGPLKQAIRDAFLLFAAGHEFAHAALGHLEGGATHPYSLADRVSCTIMAPEDHARELDADRAGTLLMMTASLRARGLPFWFTGPLAGFFLRGAGVLYHHLRVLGGTGVTDTSHPPIAERMRAVDETARGALPDDMAASYGYWTSTLDVLAARFEDAAEAGVAPLVTQGWNLASVWTQTRIG